MRFCKRNIGRCGMGWIGGSDGAVRAWTVTPHHRYCTPKGLHIGQCLMPNPSMRASVQASPLSRRGKQFSHPSLSGPPTSRSVTFHETTTHDLFTPASSAQSERLSDDFFDRTALDRPFANSFLDGRWVSDCRGSSSADHIPYHIPYQTWCFVVNPAGSLRTN